MNWMFHYQVMDGHELDVSLSRDGHELEVSLSNHGWT